MKETFKRGEGKENEVGRERGRQGERERGHDFSLYALSQHIHETYPSL